MKSEFGRGLVVNLIKFSEHFHNPMSQKMRSVKLYLSQTAEGREQMISDNPPSNFDYGTDVRNSIKSFLACEYKVYGSFEAGVSSLITLWANGATDHLYEIRTPKGKEWSEIRKLVKELQTKGLDMGHGFKDKLYELKDVSELQELTKRICILIDRKIGLKPDWGEW